MEAEGPQAKRQKVEKEEEQVVPDEKVESEKVEAKQGDFLLYSSLFLLQLTDLLVSFLRCGD